MENSDKMEVKKIDQTYFLCPFLFVLLCFNFAIICGRLCFTKESVGFSLWAQFQRPPLERSCGKTLGQGIEALPSCQYRAQYNQEFFFVKLKKIQRPVFCVILFFLYEVKCTFKSITWDGLVGWNEKKIN